MHFDAEGHSFILLTQADDGFGNYIRCILQVDAKEICPILPDERDEIMVH